MLKVMLFHLASNMSLGYENNEIDDVTIKGSLLLIKYFFMISGQQVFVLEEPNEHQVFV